MSSAPLDRLPPLASTGVGSLPFTRPADAVRHATHAYDLPFCPQLPHLYGDMIHEWLGSDPGRCGWTPDRDRQLPGAWDQFVDRVSRRPPSHRIVKLQVTGPVTLAMALERAAGRSGVTRDTRALAAEIAVWLAASAREQATSLAELGLGVLLVVDEPGLASAGVTPDAAGLWDPLRSAAGAWGLHVCGAVPWALVDAIAPDALSFDLTRGPLDANARATLTRLIARGGHIIWGIVDPVDPKDSEAAAATLAAAITAIARPGPLANIAGASLASPSCGTGRLSVSGERLVAAVLSAAIDATRGAMAVLAGTASTTTW